MSIGSVEVRWAREADVRALYDGPVPTMRARVALVDGEPAGIVGWRMKDEMAYVFSKVTDRLRPHRKVILREARRIMADLGDLPAYCVADSNEPGSRRLLARLGWTPMGDGGLHVWPKPS